MENEIWKDIPEWEGHYQASSLGRIRSLDREFINKSKIKRFYKGIVLSSFAGKLKRHKYYKVTLSRFGGKQKMKFVHVLVCSAFNEKIKDKPCVLHLNNNKLDNNKSNLRWGTDAENRKDAQRDGLLRDFHKFGWEYKNSKFSKEFYTHVIKMYNNGYSANDIMISLKVRNTVKIRQIIGTYIIHKKRMDEKLNINQ